MATNLQYGSVLLANVQTMEFRQIPQRDPSNTDQYFQRFVITVRSFATVGGAYIAGGPAPFTGAVQIPGAAVGDTAGQLEIKLRTVLGQDRQALTYTMEGVTMVYSDSSIDCDNGPKVRELSVLHVTPQTLRIEFSVEAALIICPNFTSGSGYASPSGGDSPIINNRWACIDDVDENFQTTRHWQGIMRIANSGGGTLSPQKFRDLVMPPLATGWRRISMHFAGDPDNLTLASAITDREMIGPSPPWPSATMEFTHVESTGVGASEANAASVPFGVGVINVRLSGGKSADKRVMFSWAATIVNNRLQIGSENNPAPQNSFRILEYSLADHQGPDTNIVEINCKVAHVPTATDFVGVQNWLVTVAMSTIGTPLQNLPPLQNADGVDIQYDPNVAYWLGPYATATLATLFACYLQSPCSTTHAMTSGTGQGGEDTESGTTISDSEPPSTTYSQYPISTDPKLSSPPLYSADQAAAVYQHYQLDSEFERQRHRAAMPIAASSNGYDPTLPTVVVCDLAPTTCIRIIRIHGERLGTWPVMVAQDQDFVDSNGIQNFYLRGTIKPRAPILSSDGHTYFYGADAELYYIMSRPPQLTEPLSVGSLPWDKSTPYANMMPPTAFVLPDDQKYGIS
ncbi:MAG: hypothetical protein KGL39_37230 [Patescibacteria group bacterium]|nr:hypothetical protein [Patescibacteria group bacterium]